MDDTTLRLEALRLAALSSGGDSSLSLARKYYAFLTNSEDFTIFVPTPAAPLDIVWSSTSNDPSPSTS